MAPDTRPGIKDIVDQDDRGIRDVALDRLSEPRGLAFLADDEAGDLCPLGRYT